MLKGLLPPTHRVDAPGVYVFPQDSAWDQTRLEEERGEMVALLLAEKKREAIEVAARQAAKAPDELTDDERQAAEDSVALTVAEHEDVVTRHPVARWFAGLTRFDPQALDQSPRGQVRIGDYFREGVAPAMFHLRRVPYQTRIRLDPHVIADPVTRLSGWLRAGVERITCGERVLWAATPEKPEIPDEWIERIAGADAFGNLLALAGACAQYSRPLDDTELPRSA